MTLFSTDPDELENLSVSGATTNYMMMVHKSPLLKKCPFNLSISF